MTDHSPTPWAYRSSPHDDWGWIRGPKTDDGIAPLVALARSGQWEQEAELDQHRINKTDPYGPNALFIVKAVNNHDALVKALTDALCELTACAKQLKYRPEGSVDRAIGAARHILGVVSRSQETKND